MLHIEGLRLGYDGEPVLDGVDLKVGAGQFVSLIGPSGSGKTSVLRAIAGLQKAEAGRVELAVQPGEVGFLFQDDALLPWRTASQNVALGLTIRGRPKAEALDVAGTWLARLGLEGFGDRYPRELSGGQRKRVAIAQVLALEPKFLLMDEPFASLDAIVRARITQDLIDLVEREGQSVLLVTHDLEEALAVSDRVAVLSQGPYAHIIAEKSVPVPRPRDVLKARTHPAFGPLLTQLWDALTDAQERRLEAAE